MDIREMFLNITENKDFPYSKWMEEINNKKTLLGYYDWVTSKIEKESITESNVEYWIGRLSGLVPDESAPLNYLVNYLFANADDIAEGLSNEDGFLQEEDTIITLNGAEHWSSLEDFKEEMKRRGYFQTGVYSDQYHPYFVGLPLFNSGSAGKGLCGPMLDGDNKYRYETWDVYEALSR